MAFKSAGALPAATRQRARYTGQSRSVASLPRSSVRKLTTPTIWSAAPMRGTPSGEKLAIANPLHGGQTRTTLP